MSTTTFDTLTAARELEAAGIERHHAEAIAKVVSRGDERAATKSDLDTATAAARSELGTIRWVVDVQNAISLATFAIVAAKLL